MPDLWKLMTDGFMPHGYCLRWDGPLLVAFIAGNVGIALAYFIIPVALRYFARKRQDLPYGHMFKLFAAFILSCGLTHLAKVWTLYQPAYWIEAVLDLWTAAVSLITAALLIPLIPKALLLRSPNELEEANQKLQLQIEETRKAENIAEVARKEAEAARDAAISANNIKSQFVANISHEIRTPMSGVIGLAELLTQDPDPADAKELSMRVFDSSKRLLGVLNSLLDFSRLEAGKVQTESIAFDLRSLLDDVIALIKPETNSKQIKLETMFDAALPTQLVGDESKIRQVLLNYANNAVKFTERGTITISAKIEDTQANSMTILFSVADTGIGISQNSQGHLFQPFRQADGSTRRKYGGTGLGLSISKQFVELMDGQTGFVSEESRGSTFWFRVTLRLEP